MGARPIAVLDALRFGPVTAGPGAGNATNDEIQRNRQILDGVIRGIGFYGNCFGVPTVGGEIVFEPCYSNNPLVNAWRWESRGEKNCFSRKQAAWAIQ